jgi:hypothetical protein
MKQMKLNMGKKGQMNLEDEFIIEDDDEMEYKNLK